ncbi:NaeI family type II restriction endonuclease [Streptomyces sp. NPDC016845]|uniref:NaeI family type II restriction endonuclease n=1 Tax=Streptomyces sp. NPDC016845 TaxID=3364972 RepID=UPI0037A7BBA6
MTVENDVLFDVHEPAHDGHALSSIEDSDVARVAQWFMARWNRADLEARFSRIFRQSFDEVLDGQRTGRYDVKDLEKTEKTYLGTKVEIICRSDFGLPRGERMDYRIDGVEADAKFSLDGRWMIPREATGHVCLLMAANDANSTFSVGLVKIRPEILTASGNQDGKKNISKAGRRSISWLYEGGRLSQNLLLQLEPEVRRSVMAVPPGQNRVDQLFRRVQGSIVDRNAVVTVAKQLDAPKRVRDARSRLADEGVVILGAQNESPRIAEALDLPVPEKGTWVAVRLVPAPAVTDRRTVVVGGECYATAEPGEKNHPAPEIRY